MVTVSMPAFTQVSSNEINYFSRCRNILDDHSRLICYDDLYDRAVRAATPGNDATRVMQENRRMREELARIREQSGSTSAGEPAAESGNRVRYPVTDEDAAFSRRGAYPATAKIEDFGKKESSIVINEDGKEELYDRIAALRKIPDGWVITLDSGQVWRQMISKSYRLRAGQEVKISPSSWGNSYHLSVSKLGGFIQVERVK